MKRSASRLGYGFGKVSYISLDTYHHSLPNNTAWQYYSKVHDVPSGVRTPANIYVCAGSHSGQEGKSCRSERLWRTTVTIPPCHLHAYCCLLPTETIPHRSHNAHFHHLRNLVDKTHQLPKFYFVCSTPRNQTTIVIIPQKEAVMAFGRDGRRKSAPPPCAADRGFGSTPEEVDSPGCSWGWHRWHNKVCFVPS